MTIRVLLHMTGEDPILGEIEEYPQLNATMLVVNNPRRRDGKDLHYIQEEVVTVIWPLRMISFIEILPSVSEEKLIGPVRE
ncbi:MAG TPA: hypothetical protein G4O08_12030 [Anaerolineae bacterium]|nr:hypothetical protein [Anaerolineae bacterium]